MRSVYNKGEYTFMSCGGLGPVLSPHPSVVGLWIYNQLYGHL